MAKARPKHLYLIQFNLSGFSAIGKVSWRKDMGEYWDYSGDFSYSPKDKDYWQVVYKTKVEYRAGIKAAKMVTRALSELLRPA
jgi:hypothetical protein